MLSDKDIQKLTEVFATRDEIVLKTEFEDLREDFNQLQVAIDGYAKIATDYFQEMKMLSHKIDRHERWIQQLADKLGVKLSA